ncbi:MAG TPA: hypothetical protein VMV18_13735, partial [bacterium]|nr:hypothetical protein [bacterium]
MTSRSRLVLAGAVASLALAAAACGGSSKGGNPPTITSFTASPASMPLGGGEVTFHWTVTGASLLDLEPGVGAVTGTSATLAVTSSATYTLTATNSHGLAQATTNIVIGAPITVQGTVTAVGPLAGVTVVVLGQPGTIPAVTDATGSFRIDRVVPPYDIATVYPIPGSPILAWHGVTRPDPRLDSSFGFFLSPFGAGVSGTVASGAGFPEAPNTTTTISLYSPGSPSNSGTTASATDSTWSSGL